jgi:hypothetical protein
MLGTISAPPLSQSLEGPSLVGGWSCRHDILLQLAAAYVDLIQTVDHCIERLKVSTGLRLGIGPFSPSVERVDLASMGRKLKPLFARRTLAESLLRQVESLQRLIPRSSESLPGTEPLPEVVSLAWIDMTRNQLGVTLSQALSMLLATDQLNASDPFLMSSVDLASEEKGHLSATFGIHPDIFNLAKTEATQFTVCCRRMRSHLCAVSVVLWELELEGSTQAADQVLTMKWLDHLQRHLIAVLEAEKELKTICQDDACDGAQNETTSPTEKVFANDQQSGQIDMEILEHSVEDNIGAAANTGTFRAEERRALIYSGRGSIQKRPSSEETTSGNFSFRAPESHLVVQTKVLGELQTRLSTMQTIEEYDMNGNDASDSEDELPECDKELSSLFKPATGELLAELQMILQVDN